MSRSLLSTPSGGEFEVLRALYLARGHDGNHVSSARLLRHLPAHTLQSEVETILEAESATFVDEDGSGNYTLTTAGVARSRAHKPRHGKIPVV